MHQPFLVALFSSYIYVALQKADKFYVGLRLHELAVLYNPPRLKGFPNFPSLPPLPLSLSLYSLDSPHGSEAWHSTLIKNSVFVNFCEIFISYAPEQFFFATLQKLHLKEWLRPGFPKIETNLLHMMVSLFLDESHYT